VKQLYNHRKTILRSSISPSLLLPMPSLLVDVPVGLWWACHQELLALPQLLWWSKSLRCPRYAHSTLLLLLRYTAKVHPSPQTNKPSIRPVNMYWDRLSGHFGTM
jgi:hypothetical protein